MRDQRATQARQGDGAGDEPALHPEGDVHGPVHARHLAELPGAVQGIDDPNTLRGQAGRAVGALLGQHGIVRALRGEPLEQQFVGLVVAGLAQVVTGQLRHAEREEQLSSLGGQACRKGDVGGERTHSEVTVALATWPAAAEHGAVLLRTGRSA